MKVFVKYEERIEYEENPYPDDKWNRGDIYWDFYISGVYIKPKKNGSFFEQEFWLETKEKPERVYVTWLRYDSYDTFGSDNDRGEILDVYLTQQEAEREVAKLNAGTHDMSYRFKGWGSNFKSANYDCFLLKDT